MKRFICYTLALVSFVALVVFPWLYWEAARHVMRDEPSQFASLVPKHGAELIWWGMGIGVLAWVPLSIIFAASVGYFFIAIGRAKKPEGPATRFARARSRTRSLAQTTTPREIESEPGQHK